MVRVLIINAAKSFHHSKGELNQLLAEDAHQHLLDAGCQVQRTDLEQGYDIQQEIEKYVWADVVIYQQPAWWMGAPWTLKKYLDEVLTEGHGSLYHNDGRSRSDPSKHYGSGGALLGKKYLISCTWNAPTEAFTAPDQFFEGKGLDTVYFGFHKLNQFLGMQPLPSFSCHDVIKAGSIEEDRKRYREHLSQWVVSAKA